MAEITIKVSSRGELRRFRFPKGGSFLSLQEELKKVLLLSPEAELSIQYRDDEGDNITMSSDLELSEALQISSSSNILHLSVSVLDAGLPRVPPATSSPAPVPAPASAFVHPSPIPFASSPYSRPQYSHPHPSPRQMVPTATPVGPSLTSSGSLPAHFIASNHQRPVPIPVQTPVPPQAFPTSPAPAISRGFASQCHQQRVQLQEWREEREKAFKQWKAQEKQAKKQEKKQAKAAAKQPMLIARFVKDVTVQDGMFFPPNTAFVKTWRLRNESNIHWPEGAVELVFDGKNSDQMGGPEAVPVPTAVPAGSEVDITLPLVSPGKPGRYVGFWRLRTRDGRKFGQRLWVQIHVISPEEEAKYNEDLTRWRPMLEKLQALGYYDTKQNIKVLSKYNGNMPKVVKKLAKKMKKSVVLSASAAASSPACPPSPLVHPLNLPPTT